MKKRSLQQKSRPLILYSHPPTHYPLYSTFNTPMTSRRLRSLLRHIAWRQTPTIHLSDTCVWQVVLHTTNDKLTERPPPPQVRHHLGAPQPPETATVRQQRAASPHRHFTIAPPSQLCRQPTCRTPTPSAAPPAFQERG